MATRVEAKPQSKRIRPAANPWPRLRLLTTLVFLALAGSGAVTGGTSYVSIGPLAIACPLGVAQIFAATRSFLLPLALAGLAGLSPIVLFGRAFCGWICPGRWIFNRGPGTAKKPWRGSAWVQRLMVGGVIAVAWWCRSPVFCTICPAGLFCRGAIAAGTGGNPLPTLGWLSALVGFEWASGRSWCRDLCPLGAALGQLSRLNPFLGVRANPDRCRPCLACERACAMGLNLSRDADLSACTKCLACQPACPRNAVEGQWRVLPR